MFAQDDETLEKLMQSLAEEFALFDKGDVNAYLGIDVQKTHEGFKLVQTGLIDKII